MPLEPNIRQQYPIDLQVEGWFFRCTEASAGHYVAEGTDVEGRTVSISGSDPDELLPRCAETARRMIADLSRRISN